MSTDSGNIPDDLKDNGASYSDSDKTANEFKKEPPTSPDLDQTYLQNSSPEGGNDTSLIDACESSKSEKSIIIADTKQTTETHSKVLFDNISSLSSSDSTTIGKNSDNLDLTSSNKNDLGRYSELVNLEQFTKENLNKKRHASGASSKASIADDEASDLELAIKPTPKYKKRRSKESQRSTPSPDEITSSNTQSNVITETESKNISSPDEEEHLIPGEAPEVFVEAGGKIKTVIPSSAVSNRRVEGIETDNSNSSFLEKKVDAVNVLATWKKQNTSLTNLQLEQETASTSTTNLRDLNKMEDEVSTDVELSENSVDKSENQTYNNSDNQQIDVSMTENNSSTADSEKKVDAVNVLATWKKQQNTSLTNLQLEQETAFTSTADLKEINKMEYEVSMDVELSENSVDKLENQTFSNNDNQQIDVSMNEHNADIAEASLSTDKSKHKFRTKSDNDKGNSKNKFPNTSFFKAPLEELYEKRKHLIEEDETTQDKLLPCQDFADASAESKIIKEGNADFTSESEEVLVPRQGQKRKCSRENNRNLPLSPEMNTSDVDEYQTKKLKIELSEKHCSDSSCQNENNEIVSISNVPFMEDSIATDESKCNKNWDVNIQSEKMSTDASRMEFEVSDESKDDLSSSMDTTTCTNKNFYFPPKILSPIPDEDALSGPPTECDSFAKAIAEPEKNINQPTDFRDTYEFKTMEIKFSSDQIKPDEAQITDHHSDRKEQKVETVPDMKIDDLSEESDISKSSINIKLTVEAPLLEDEDALSNVPEGVLQNMNPEDNSYPSEIQMRNLETSSDFKKSSEESDQIQESTVSDTTRSDNSEAEIPITNAKLISQAESPKSEESRES